MKSFTTILSLFACLLLASTNMHAQDFQGKAYYFSKTNMDMSRWTRGGQMSEAQKKQMAARMKPWLEKTYVLTFNKEESMFKEDEKLAGPVSGRAPSVWGSSFSAGPQYKNVKTKIFLQDQEFFGKQFLIKEDMKPLDWVMGTETKQIGKYTCFKATASRPSTEINWTRTNRDRRAKSGDKAKKEAAAKTTEIAKIEEDAKEDDIEMVEITAWYTPMIPVSQGPSEYWGLPGLILEVSAGNNTMLCSKIIMNPEEKTKIEAPKKGQVVSKQEYNEIITEKMQEMRDNRGRGSGRSGR
jgi:GLPGLI family protein